MGVGSSQPKCNGSVRGRRGRSPLPLLVVTGAQLPEGSSNLRQFASGNLRFMV